MKKRFVALSREQLAAVLKERIYGSVTILAVNVGLLLKADLTLQHAYIAIISTVIGLWLAGLFAVVLAYRVVHDKNMPRREFAHEIAVHRGLLLAGVSSLIMLTLASAHVISLHAAIIADIGLTITAITVTILRAAKTSSNSVITAVISIGVQIIIAGLIILLKIGAK